MFSSRGFKTIILSKIRVIVAIDPPVSNIFGDSVDTNEKNDGMQQLPLEEQYL